MLNKKLDTKTVIIVFGIIAFFLIMGTVNIPDKKTIVVDKKCMQSLQCWGKENAMRASIKCDGYIERLAKYSFKWTDGVIESKFSQMRWHDKISGSITYVGDKIQFQNGFGAFSNVIYECDYNPITKNVINVRVNAGRL